MPRRLSYKASTHNASTIFLRSTLLLFNSVLFSSIAMAQPPAGVAVKAFASGPDPLSAPRQEGSVLVSLRVLRAFQRYDSPPQQHFADRIDARLIDLAAKLEKLPFRRFEMVGGDSRFVALKGKETFPLIGGQSVTVRPLYLEESKVGMSLKWRDRAGDAILDTRMHFDRGESMLAGTDSLQGPEDGIILAIKVESP